MIPVLLVGHGGFAAGLRDAAEMIVGPQEAFEVVPLRPEDDVEIVSRRLEEALVRLDVPADGEVLIFADLFGAAPANAAAMLLRTRSRLEVVAGVNLPMLLDSLLAREGETAHALAERAVAAGREGVRDVAAVLRAALAGTGSTLEEAP